MNANQIVRVVMSVFVPLFVLAVVRVLFLLWRRWFSAGKRG